MTQDTPAPARFIGCDVGKAGIVVFDSRDGRIRTIPNQPDDLAAFATGLDHTCLAVCEATGGHEAALLSALMQAGRAAHRADARKVKAFIRSFGTLGKTDAIDARALARSGQERHPRLARWQPPNQERDRLQTLVLTRRDLVDQRVACKNRLSSPGAQVGDPISIAFWPASMPRSRPSRPIPRPSSTPINLHTATRTVSSLIGSAA